MVRDSPVGEPGHPKEMVMDNNDDLLDRASKRKKKHYAKQKEKRRAQRVNNSQPETDTSSSARTLLVHQETTSNTDTCVQGFSSEQNKQPSGFFEIGIAPNKGLGLFALEDIPRGTLIHKEIPLLILHRTTALSQLPTLIKALPAHKLAQFTALAHSLPDGRCNQIKTPAEEYDKYLYAIWEVNTFACPEGRAAVYPTFSRLNHGCTPNIMISHASATSTAMIAHAAVEISQGEELTWSYVDICQDQSARQKALKAAAPGLGSCACKLCAAPASPADAYKAQTSDLRRTRIHDLRSLLGFTTATDTRRPKRSEAIAASAVELTQLLEEEGLQGLELCKTFGSLASLRAWNNVDAAIAWKKKEVQGLKWIFGAGSQKVQRCEAELKDLEQGKIVDWEQGKRIQEARYGCPCRPGKSTC